RYYRRLAGGDFSRNEGRKRIAHLHEHASDRASIRHVNVRPHLPSRRRLAERELQSAGSSRLFPWAWHEDAVIENALETIGASAIAAESNPCLTQGRAGGFYTTDYERN